MHYSFFIYALCALAGWSVGHTIHVVRCPPSWLRDL